MTRKKIRKFVKVATKYGLGRPENKEALDEALSICHNSTTKATLRRRIALEAR